MKIQLSELNLTYVLGWYGTCDTNQEFDLNTLSSSISSVLQIAEDNHTWKSFEPGNYSSDFNRLVPGHIYYFTFNRGTNEVEIPDLIKTNYSDTPMSQQRITDQCGGNSSNGPDFGSGNGDSGQTPYTETPIGLSQMCCGDMENSHSLTSGQRLEISSGEEFVSQYNGTLCFNDISADLNGNTVLYYVSFDSIAEEVHLEVTVQTSNQINNIFSFTTDDGKCFTGTLDYMTPTINRWTEATFPTPTPDDTTTNPDFGSGVTATPTPKPVDPVFSPRYYDYLGDSPTPLAMPDDSISDDIGSSYDDAGGDFSNPTDPIYGDAGEIDEVDEHIGIHDVGNDGIDDSYSDDSDSGDYSDTGNGTTAEYNDSIHQMHKERISVLTNSRNYSFDFQWTGDVPSESLDVVTINVENNSISDITRGGVSINTATTAREYYTMDVLFLYVETEVVRNPDVANISYNEELGYISSFDLDMSTDQEFDKVGFQVSNFNAGDLNNSVDDSQTSDNIEDVDGWNEETDYYEEGEIPVVDNATGDEPSDTNFDANPISELPDESSSDSDADSDADAGSDFGLIDEDDYGLDGTVVEPDSNLDDMFNEAPDSNLDDMYNEAPDADLGDTHDAESDNYIDDHVIEPDAGVDDGYTDGYTDGVSNSVGESSEGVESELPMDGSMLDEVSTSTDGYLNPLPNDLDTPSASDGNSWEDLDTLE